MNQAVQSQVKKLKKQYKNWQKERAERPKEFALDYGEQDPMDIISYAGLEEQADYLNIDGLYVRSLFISGYPFVASSGWLNSLINFNHNIDISYHIAQVDANQALPKLHRKITELESTKRAMIRTGKIVGPEVTDPLESASELRDKIQRGQEKLFQASIYVTITAPRRLKPLLTISMLRCNCSLMIAKSFSMLCRGSTT